SLASSVIEAMTSWAWLTYRRQRRLCHHHVLLDLGAASGDGADHLALNHDRKATRHVGEVAHAHAHAQRVLFRRIAGREALGGGGDRFPLRGDNRKVARPVHHQEGDEPAALIGHRQADLAAKLVRLGDAGREHLEARRLGEAMACNEIRHGESLYAASPRVLGTNNSSAVTGCLIMPWVSAWPMSSSITLRFGAMP